MSSACLCCDNRWTRSQVQMGSRHEQRQAVQPRRSTFPRVLNTLLILELFEKPVRLVRAESPSKWGDTKKHQIRTNRIFYFAKLMLAVCFAKRSGLPISL